MVRDTFRHSTGEKQEVILKESAAFLDNLMCFETEESVNNAKAEIYIREQFTRFLNRADFQMAPLDFEILLQEIGEKKRKDGTISWYHQLTPILQFLALLKSGHLKLEMLEHYGGLETLIRTHLRHDSYEDFPFGLGAMRLHYRSIIKKKYTKPVFRDVELENNKDARRDVELENNEILVDNIRLMSKKRVKCYENGKPIIKANGSYEKQPLYRNTDDYMFNMTFGIRANPVTWCLKNADGTHNMATMLNTAEFPAEKQKIYCNEREAMYGPRHDVALIAQEKWKPFKDIIEYFDCMMGVVIYTNFCYFKYVTDAYPDKHQPGDFIYPVGIARYLPKAMEIELPKAFHPFHILVNRLIKMYDQDKCTHSRIGNFLEQGLFPSLEPYKQHFPNIFIEKEPAETMELKV